MTRILSHAPAPLALPPVSADGPVPAPLAWVDAICVAIEPSPDAWAAAFAYLYSRPGGPAYVASLEAL